MRVTLTPACAMSVCFTEYPLSESEIQLSVRWMCASMASTHSNSAPLLPDSARAPPRPPRAPSSPPRSPPSLPNKPRAGGEPDARRRPPRVLPGPSTGRAAPCPRPLTKSLSGRRRRASSVSSPASLPAPPPQCRSSLPMGPAPILRHSVPTIQEFPSVPRLGLAQSRCVPPSCVRRWLPDPLAAPSTSSKLAVSSCWPEACSSISEEPQRCSQTPIAELALA